MHGVTHATRERALHGRGMRRPFPTAFLSFLAFAGPVLAGPLVNVGPISVIEGIPGTPRTVKVPVTLSAATTKDVQVTLSTSDLGAKADADYRSLTTTITIPHGQTAGFMAVSLVNDYLYEPTQKFRVGITSVTGDGATAGTATADVTIFDDDIPPDALRGSLGAGTGVPRVDGVFDPWPLEDWLLAAGYGNTLTLGGADSRFRALNGNGRPTTGNGAKLRLGTFAPPAKWPPQTAADSPHLATPARLESTTYSGAFEPGVPRVDAWDQGWTVGVNGNEDVWRFFGGTLAPGTALYGQPAPVADHTCPVNSTYVGPLSAIAGPLANDETGLFAGVAGDYDVCRLPSVITVDVRLTNDNVYEIGTYNAAMGMYGTFVGDGATPRDQFPPARAKLTVEAGTLVLGTGRNALIVTRGSKISAIGTAKAPIVLTSLAQIQARFDGNSATSPGGGQGGWAGLVLSGNGRLNACAVGGYPTCEAPMDGDIGVYGGNDDGGSSGTLKYVVIRESGADIIDNSGNEFAGLTLDAVGRATVIDHIQVHDTGEDGIQFIGGAVFVTHAVVTGAYDDSIDADQGWIGGAQFVSIIQRWSTERGLGRGLEIGYVLNSSQPRPTFPLLANITVMGPRSRGAGGVLDDRQGVLLQGGVRVQLWNSVVTGDFPEGCLDIDTGATFDRAGEAGGTAPSAPGRHLFLRNTVVDCQTYSVIDGS